jgi:hypothetical protein
MEEAGMFCNKKLQEITAACNHNLVLALNKQDCVDIQE